MTAISPSSTPDTHSGLVPRQLRIKRARKRRRRVVGVLAVFLVLALVAAPLALALRGSGLKTAFIRKLAPEYAPLDHPWVTLSRPARDDNSVPCDAFIAVDVQLPNNGHVIDAATVNNGSVRLIRRGDKSVVSARVNTSAAGDAIVLTPEQHLAPNSFYRFEILPALKDTAGVSFKHYVLNFTTGGEGPITKLPVAFEQVALPQTNGRIFTGVTIGPDDRLYACTYDGSIFRYDLAADGTIAAAAEINTVKLACGGPRLITGICFDPASTAASPILYVSHGQCTRTTAEDWTGRIGRITGADFSKYDDLIVGLPRAYRDHLNNQMVFGPDGAMYVAQGSNSAMGAPDAGWGNRAEHKLTAAILRIDLNELSKHPLPLDVKTEDGGAYDPNADGAPVKLYATGLRSVYDLLWHSNGSLYAPLNGSAAGGNTPADPATGVPGIKNLRLTVPDHLCRVRPGGYYGHPNPTRGQFVLMGGNPTDAPDPVEVSNYPIGTMPDPRWEKPVLEFGRNLSPCGIIEYKGAGLTEKLNGAIFVCRYSGGKDVCILMPSADGSIREMITGVEGLHNLADPLDLVQHPKTGHLYIAEFGGKRLMLVRAKPGVESARVYRQKIGQDLTPIAAEPVQASGHTMPTTGTSENED
jgi:glucose/arabinose dehydrogenase